MYFLYILNKLVTLRLYEAQLDENDSLLFKSAYLETNNPSSYVFHYPVNLNV